MWTVFWSAIFFFCMTMPCFSGPVSSPSLLHSRYLTWPAVTSPVFLAHRTPVRATLVTYTPVHHHRIPYFVTLVGPGPILRPFHEHGSVVMNHHHRQPFWSFHDHAKPFWSGQTAPNHNFAASVASFTLPGHSVLVGSTSAGSTSSIWSPPRTGLDASTQFKATWNPPSPSTSSNQFYSRTLPRHFGGARERGQSNLSRQGGAAAGGGGTVPTANPMRASVFLQNQTMVTDSILTTEISEQDHKATATPHPEVGGETPLRGLKEGVPVVATSSQNQTNSAEAHGYSYTTVHGTGVSHTSVRFTFPKASAPTGSGEKADLFEPIWTTTGRNPIPRAATVTTLPANEGIRLNFAHVSENFGHKPTDPPKLDQLNADKPAHLIGVKVYTYSMKESTEGNGTNSIKILDKGSVTETTDVEQTTTKSDDLLTAAGKNVKRDSKQPSTELPTPDPEDEVTLDPFLFDDDFPDATTRTTVAPDGVEESGTTSPKPAPKRTASRPSTRKKGSERLPSDVLTISEEDSESMTIPDDSWVASTLDEIKTTTPAFPIGELRRRSGQEAKSTPASAVDFEALTTFRSKLDEEVEAKGLTFSPEEAANETVVVTFDGPEIGSPTVVISNSKIAKKSAGKMRKTKPAIKESGLRKRSQPVFEVLDESQPTANKNEADKTKIFKPGKGHTKTAETTLKGAEGASASTQNEENARLVAKTKLLRSQPPSFSTKAGMEKEQAGTNSSQNGSGSWPVKISSAKNATKLASSGGPGVRQTELEETTSAPLTHRTITSKITLPVRIVTDAFFKPLSTKTDPGNKAEQEGQRPKNSTQSSAKTVDDQVKRLEELKNEADKNPQVLLLSKQNSSMLKKEPAGDRKQQSPGREANLTTQSGQATGLEAQFPESGRMANTNANISRPGFNHDDEDEPKTATAQGSGPYTTTKPTKSTSKSTKTAAQSKTTSAKMTESKTESSEARPLMRKNTHSVMQEQAFIPPPVGVRVDTPPTEVVRRNASLLDSSRATANITTKAAPKQTAKSGTANPVKKKFVKTPMTKSPKVNRPEILGRTKVAGDTGTDIFTVATELPGTTTASSAPNATTGGTITALQKPKQKSKLAKTASGLHSKERNGLRTTEASSAAAATTEWTSIDLRTNSNLEPDENFTWAAFLTTLKPLAEHHRLQIICPDADNAIPNQPTFSEIQEKENRAWVLGLSRAKTEKPKMMNLERKGPFHPLKRLAKPAPGLEVTQVKLPVDDIFPALTMEGDIMMATETEHPDVTPSRNNLMLGKKMFVFMDKYRGTPTTSTQMTSTTPDLFADLFGFDSALRRSDEGPRVTSAPKITHSTSRRFPSTIDDKVRIMKVDSESDSNPGLSSSLAIHLGKIKQLRSDKTGFVQNQRLKPYWEARNKKSVGFRAIGGKYDPAQLEDGSLQAEGAKFLKKTKNVRLKAKKKSPTTKDPWFTGPRKFEALAATRLDATKIPLQDTTDKTRDLNFVFSTKTIDGAMKIVETKKTKNHNTSKEKRTTTLPTTTTIITSTISTTSHAPSTGTTGTTARPTETTATTPLAKTTKNLERAEDRVELPPLDNNSPFSSHRKRKILPVGLDMVRERSLRRRIMRLLAQRRRMERLWRPVMDFKIQPAIDEIYLYE